MQFKEICKSPVVDGESSCRVIENRRAYVSKARQKGYVAHWQSSGLSQRAFCLHYNINIKTFRRWRSECDEVAVSSKPSPLSTPAALVKSQDHHFCLKLPNGVALELLGEVNTSWLLPLLVEVGQCKFN